MISALGSGTGGAVEGAGLRLTAAGHGLVLPVVRLDDAASVATKLEADQPENPFATAGYAQARAGEGARPVAIEFRSAEGQASCLGVLAGGPLVRTLEIPSMPSLPEADFGPAVRRLVRDLRIGLLNVFPYHSRASRLPEWFPAEWRRQTDEFVWWLNGPPEVTALHKSARQGVRMAERMGCRVLSGTDVGILATHEQVLASSRRRRLARGETPGVAPSTGRMRAFIAHGAGIVFQSVGADGAVHSSAMVLRSARGAYLHSMGSSELGFEIGAAKLLVFEAAVALQAHGVEQFNLGSAATPGLRMFKTLFGAIPRPVEAGVFRTMGRYTRRALTAGDRLLRLVGRGRGPA